MLWKLISLFHWSSKQCFILHLLGLMRACCLLLIEQSKQSMYIVFNYFSSFSSYGNYLLADNDCYHLFFPPVCWIFCTATCSLCYCKLTACSIPSGINVWLPKAKYSFLFHDWMIYFVTKHILFHKFIVSSFIQISNLELHHADGNIHVRCNICSEKINSDK